MRNSQTIETINTQTGMRGTAVVFPTREEAEKSGRTVDDCEGGYYPLIGSDGGFNIDVNDSTGRKMLRTLEEDATGEAGPNNQRRAQRILAARG